MPKLKTARCIICKTLIKRHDANRVTLKVGPGSDGQGVYKEVHLVCSQKDVSHNA